MSLRGFANIILVVIVVIVILVGALGYFVLVKKEPTVTMQTNTLTVSGSPQASELPSSSPTPKDEIADWETYTNGDLGYSIKYFPTWKVDESGLENSAGKEVIINPPDAEPFTSYISILIDLRSLDLIRQVHNSSQAPVFAEKQVIFAGQDAFEYTTSASDLVGIYIPYGEKIYLVSTSKYSLKEVQQSLASFQFVK